MSSVTVKYFMVFSELTGKKSERININEGDSVGDLIDMLIKKYGRKLKKHLGGEGRRAVLFLVNGKERGRSELLKHGDEVVISYPVGGG